MMVFFEGDAILTEHDKIMAGLDLMPTLKAQVESNRQDNCQHDWIEVNNEKVQGVELCGKCFIARPMNREGNPV